tara:strand:+ start:692 stop:1411 length:720 start_codon:yes stop_codon:yes gene_type:complete
MLKAKKSLSQNFLTDKNISNKIIKQTNINDQTILEIGPGYGFMTDHILLRNPKKIYLIEKDKLLVKYLKNKYQNNKKIFIIEEDILNVNLSNFKNLVIISNLPYNISTKIILYLFNFNKNICELIFMIQKEVALKFDYNLPNMNKYKFLTYIVSIYSRLFDVSSKVFFPKPKVQSTVVKFKFVKKEFDIDKAVQFSNLIFKNVRKKINNNISIKNKSKLLEKRVNQLTIDDLLNIYNFF